MQRGPVSIPSDEADAVDDKFCFSAGVLRVEIRPHHAPLLTQLHRLKVPERIEFKRESWL